MSQGLCFYNNGSTLYSFGGLAKDPHTGSLQPTDRIESLSKGQNNWKLLEVRLPQPAFDVGSIELPETHEIILYGGFKEQSQSQVYIFKVNPNSPEGQITKQFNLHGQEVHLGAPDFFLVNGIQIKIGRDQNGSNTEEILVSGHTSIHAFDKTTRLWRVIQQLAA